MYRGVAQFGSALALGARCRRFKSCRPDSVHGPNVAVDEPVGPEEMVRRYEDSRLFQAGERRRIVAPLK